MTSCLSRTLTNIALVLIIGIAGLFFGGKASASNPPLAYINFEGYKIQSSSNGDDKLYSAWNDLSFNIKKEGDPTYLHDWISSSVIHQNFGNNTLGVELISPPTKSAKQRIEFELANNNYGNNFNQKLNDLRWYSFYLYIHRQSDDVLNKGVVFTQVWQGSHAYKDGYSKFPPLSLRFVDNSAYKFDVLVSKDCPTDPRGCNEPPIYTYEPGLKKEQWYKFVIGFKPSTDREGYVEVRLNGVQLVKQSNQKNFGYNPISNSNVKISNSFVTRFGAYGAPETSSPKHVKLMFDDAKYGTSRYQVDH